MTNSTTIGRVDGMPIRAQVLEHGGSEECPAAEGNDAPRVSGPGAPLPVPLPAGEGGGRAADSGPQLFVVRRESANRYTARRPRYKRRRTLTASGETASEAIAQLLRAERHDHGARLYHEAARGGGA